MKEFLERWMTTFLAIVLLMVTVGVMFEIGQVEKEMQNLSHFRCTCEKGVK